MFSSFILSQISFICSKESSLAKTITSENCEKNLTASMFEIVAKQ